MMETRVNCCSNEVLGIGIVAPVVVISDRGIFCFLIASTYFKCFLETDQAVILLLSPTEK